VVAAGKNNGKNNPEVIEAWKKGTKVPPVSVAAGKKVVRLLLLAKIIIRWLQLVKKHLLLFQLAKNTKVAAAGKKGTKVVAAGEKAPVVVVAAPVEAGGTRPRRKGVKYNSPTKLANKFDETATLCGERSVVVVKTSEVPGCNNKKRKANPVNATIIEDAEPTTKKAKKVRRRRVAMSVHQQ
jgi:hypothetical protein